MTLRSSNPRDTPRIDFSFFETHADSDLQALDEGAKFALDMFDAVGEPYTAYTLVKPVPDIDTKQAVKDRIFSHSLRRARWGPSTILITVLTPSLG